MTLYPPTPRRAGKLRILAEPGRYFAEATGTYFCYINGQRQRRVEGEAMPALDYYLTDGLYGSMNCLVGWGGGRGGWTEVVWEVVCLCGGCGMGFEVCVWKRRGPAPARCCSIAAWWEGSWGGVGPSGVQTGWHHPVPGLFPTLPALTAMAGV